MMGNKSACSSVLTYLEELEGGVFLVVGTSREVIGATQRATDSSRCLRFACDPSITERQGQEANLGYRWRLKSADSVSNKTK